MKILQSLLKQMTVLIFLFFSLFSGFPIGQVSAQQTTSIQAGGYKPGLVMTSSKHYLAQGKMSNVLTNQMCAGADVQQRYYIPTGSDLDGDGLYDMGQVRYMRDNAVYNDDGTRKLALIWPSYNGISNNDDGTMVYYYFPNSITNLISIYGNGTSTPITNQSLWFRYSKVAPAGKPVRAVESEPVLREIPSSKNPLDAFFQVVYLIKYKVYNSIGTNVADNDYVSYILPGGDLSYMGGLGNSDTWWINNPLADNGGAGPLFSSNFVNHQAVLNNLGGYPTFNSSTNIFRTNSITRSNQLYAHTNECHTVYVSRCGNGYQDVPGTLPTNGTNTLPIANGASTPSEECDPGTPGVTNPYIPSTAPIGSTCSQTCTIIPPAGSPDIKIDKTQTYNTNTLGSDTARGSHNTSALMNYTPTGQFSFTIKLKNIGTATANPVQMTDQLPAGFTFTSCTPNNSNINCTHNASNNTLTSSSFSLTAGQEESFVVLGSLDGSTVDTTNTAKALLNGSQVDSDSVTQHAIPVVVPPAVSIQKFQSTGSASITDQHDGANPLQIQTGDTMRYRLRITNTGATANNVVLTDDFDDDLGDCSYQGVSSALSFVSAPAVGSLLADPRSLTISSLPNGTFDIVVKCTLASQQPLTLFNNNFSLTVPGQSSSPLLSNEVVAIIPQVITPPVQPVLAVTKLVRNETKNPSGVFSQADTQSTAVPVSGGDTVQYKLLVNKTSGGPVTQSVKITDIFPSGLTITAVTVAGASVTIPASNSFDIIIPTTAFSTTNIVEVLITATVPATASNQIYDNYAMLFYDNSSTSIDADADNNARIGVPGKAQLTIDKTYKDGNGNWVDSISRNPGQSFQMRLVVTNNGSATADQVYVSDQCDSRLTCSSWSIPTTSFGATIASNLLKTPNIATAYGNQGLLPGGTITIYVDGIVLSTTEGITIPNTAYVYMTPGFTTPVDNNSADIVIPTFQKLFNFSKTVSGTLSVGNTLHYTLTLCNSGQNNIASYILTDPLPSGLTYVSASASFNGVTTTNPTIVNGVLTWGCASSPNNLPTTCLLSPNTCSKLTFDASVNTVTSTVVSSSSSQYYSAQSSTHASQ